MVKNALSAMLTAQLHMMSGGNIKAMFDKQNPKPERKCLLPECQEKHRHNGGYCCAEHCQQHREMSRGR